MSTLLNISFTFGSGYFFDYNRNMQHIGNLRFVDQMAGQTYRWRLLHVRQYLLWMVLQLVKKMDYSSSTSL